MTPIEVIERAKELLRDGKSWVKGTLITNVDGAWVGLCTRLPDAELKFCIGGAICRATQAQSMTLNVSHDLQMQAAALIADKVKERGITVKTVGEWKGQSMHPWSVMVEWNNTREDYAEVVSVLDAVIADHGR